MECLGWFVVLKSSVVGRENLYEFLGQFVRDLFSPFYLFDLFLFPCFEQTRELQLFFEGLCSEVFYE